MSKIYRPEGNMQSGLDDLIATIPPAERGVCVEVGSAAGESTERFAKAFGKVICIDPWPGNMDKYFEVFKTRMRAYPHVYWFREPSLVGAQYVKDASADLVYIDAIHDAPHPFNDIQAWLPKVAPGGYIGGHDYKQGKFQCVVDAVHMHFPTHYVYQFADNSWLVKV
jgi:predicted O-methyltransferase YrrM